MPNTHINPFTKQQVDQLRENPYVKSISLSTIRFTEEFKRYFYQKFKSGMTTNQILRECGIDPDILGKSRMDGFRYTLNKCAKREEGFVDKRMDNHRTPPKSNEKTLEGRIRQLEHELAYTRQEVEFLKKIQTADMEARRQWESRHQPK